MTTKALSISGLEVGYGAALALNGVAIDVDQGEMVGIVGPNGAGKSTLLNTLAGVLAPRAGDVEIHGRFALVPEGRQLFPELTVEDNLRLGGWTIKNHDLTDVLDLFPKLAGMRSRVAGRLSGGEQQMVAIGRALMARPEILALDELSLGLAPKVVHEIISHLIELNRQRGTTVLLVEQNAKLTFEVCQRAYVIEGGEIKVHGRCADLAQSPAVRRAYLGVSDEPMEVD